MDPQPLDDDLCSGTATGTPPPKKGPLFATLDPYAPASAPSNSSSGATEAQAKIPTKKQRRRNSYKPAPKQVLEDLFSIRNESWTRFFAVSEPGILDNIEIFNDLKSKLPDEFECFRRNDGSILIDAKTQRNAEIIERLEHIATNEVKTSRDQLLNSRSGTILVPLSEFRDDENIERKLYEHLVKNNLPVVNVKVFKKTTRRQTTITCACITFDSRSLPDEVRVGFKKAKVKEDLPRPRQCRSCWRYGHLQEICRSDPCCPVCGEHNHTIDNCPHRGDHSFSGHCPNCDLDGHTAMSKNCEFYLKELETLILMRHRGIPKYEARLLLEESGRFRRNPKIKRPQASNPSHTTKQQSKQSEPPQQHQSQQQPPQEHQPQQQQPLAQEMPTQQKQPAQQQQQPQAEVVPTILPEEAHTPLPQTGPIQAKKPVNPEPPLTGNEMDVEKKLREILGYAGKSSPTLSMDEPFLSFSLDTDTAETSDDPLPSQILTRKTQQPQRSESVDTSEDPIPSQVFTRRMTPPRPQRTPKRGREYNHSPPTNREPKIKKAVPEEIHPSEKPTSTSSPKKETPCKETPNKVSLPTPSPLSRVTSLGKSKGVIPKKVKDGQHKDSPDCGCNACIRELAILKNETIQPGKQISPTFLETVKGRIIHLPVKLAFHPTDCMCRQHILKLSTVKPKGKERGLLVSNIRKSFENLRKKDSKPNNEQENEKKKDQKADKQNITVITSR